MSQQQHRIFVSSTQADRFPLGESATHKLSFDLTDNPIACLPGETMYMSLETFVCPVVRLNVRDDCNKLVFNIVGTGDVTISLTVGQYSTIEQLRIALQTAITNASIAVTLSYSSLTNKFSLQNTGTAVITLKNSPIKEIIGSNSTDLTIAVSSTVPLPRMVDLSGRSRNINVVLDNIDLQSKDSLNGTDTEYSVLATVPITVQWGNVQSYINPKNDMIKCNQRHLTKLDVSLFDLEGLPYDIGGLKWSAQINITII